MLTLNWNIIWTFIDLLVIYVIVKKFLLKPVNDIIEKRRLLIAQSLTSAEETKNNAFKLKTDYEKQLEGAKFEAETIIKSAKERASMEYDSIVKSANEEAVKKLKDADNAISLEKSKAERELYSQIGGIAVAAAEKIVSASIKKNESDRLVNEFLAEAGVSNDIRK